MKWVSACTLILLLIGLNPANAQNDLAQKLELQQRILFIIAQTVGQICYTVEQKGESFASELKGGLTRIAALDSTFQYGNAQYQGVLQQELSITIEKTQNCKLDVFNKLLDRMMPIIPIVVSTPSRQISSTDSSTIVRDFYVALGRGDGAAASALVIPEKRLSGPLSANEMTNFYSSLREPLQLLELAAIDGNNYQATYTYRASPAHACAGSAIVTVVPRGGRTLIERIKALQGC